MLCSDLLTKLQILVASLDCHNCVHKLCLEFVHISKRLNMTILGLGKKLWPVAGLYKLLSCVLRPFTVVLRHAALRV